MLDLADQFPTLVYFEFGHLPTHLQEASASFREHAYRVALTASSLPSGSPGRPEAGACLRSLLTAKDAAVRVAVEAHKNDRG